MAASTGTVGRVRLSPTGRYEIPLGYGRSRLRRGSLPRLVIGCAWGVVFVLALVCAAGVAASVEGRHRIRPMLAIGPVLSPAEGFAVPQSEMAATLAALLTDGEVHQLSNEQYVESRPADGGVVAAELRGDGVQDPVDDSGLRYGVVRRAVRAAEVLVEDEGDVARVRVAVSSAGGDLSCVRMPSACTWLEDGTSVRRRTGTTAGGDGVTVVRPSGVEVRVDQRPTDEDTSPSSLPLGAGELDRIARAPVWSG